MGKRKTSDEFINEAQLIHKNRYNYSSVKYINNYSNVIIVCDVHGEFNQTPTNHLNGCGCPKCFGVGKLDLNSFIIKSNLIHNGKYDYSLVNYKNNYTKIKIICDIHGEFEQSPQNHLQGKGCSICSESQGEKKIRKLLIEKNVEFETQKKFNSCKRVLALPFDFYIPQKNLLIEFDGEQHYKEFKHFGGKNKLKNTIINDKIKNSFAKNNGFNLIRIPYYENNNIENIINSII